MIKSAAKFLLCVSASVGMLSGAANAGQKIVGGEEASIGEFPFIVSLHGKRFGGHFCGGSLIRSNWILTAGHCVTGTTIDKVYINFHKQNDLSKAESFDVKRIIRHPQYNSSALDYDFALVELDGNSAMTPVSLNTTEINIPDREGDLNVTAAGWGVLKESGYQISNTLQKVEVPLITTKSCLQAYPNKITDRMICAGLTGGGKDSCQGDSGGPLVLRGADGDTLVGVVSWGIGCARPNKFGVYSKVNAVIDWIEQNTY